MKALITGYDLKDYYCEFDGTIEQLEEAVRKESFVRVDKAWERVMVRQHAVNQQTGQIMAETRMFLLMPIGMSVGAMDGFRVVPCNFYDVEATGEAKKHAELLKVAEEAAEKERARERQKETGIITPVSGIRSAAGNPGLRDVTRPR